MDIHYPEDHILSKFVGAFAKQLQKWLIASLCVHVPMEHSVSHRTDFREISYLKFWLKYVDAFRFLLRSDESKTLYVRLIFVRVGAGETASSMIDCKRRAVDFKMSIVVSSRALYPLIVNLPVSYGEETVDECNM